MSLPSSAEMSAFSNGTFLRSSANGRMQEILRAEIEAVRSGSDAADR